MPNLLKDLVNLVSPQAAKRPLTTPSSRLSPANQNVASSGPLADFSARRAAKPVTAEQEQEQAKMDAFVFFTMMR